ncbi:hypothetical protein NDU88_003832 [Pleurodeles waltl]|uniref:Uncharacterized protein n=1 Tax=Pleurodeles waltl TaxID=8319 RepID=A0AAV7TPK8_PLEWA|nr:hypothetical protein NDU88_003832 [Pleurodeles waltl]
MLELRRAQKGVARIPLRGNSGSGSRNSGSWVAAAEKIRQGAQLKETLVKEARRNTRATQEEHVKKEEYRRLQKGDIRDRGGKGGEHGGLRRSRSALERFRFRFTGDVAGCGRTRLPK